jgi:hypothetical protein
MELSPQLQEQIRQQLEAAKTALLDQLEALKAQPGNEDSKKDVAEKLGLLSTLLFKYQLGVPPNPKEVLEAFEYLEANISFLTRLLKQIVEAVKVIVQGIIDILQTLADRIRSLFPKEESQTAFVPGGDVRSESLVSFGLLSPEEARGMLRVPAVFAGVPNDLVIPYNPCQSNFSVRIQPMSPSKACLHIESLASISRPMEQQGLRLPGFLQSLDPRRPSMGLLDLETGELEGTVYSQLTDGRLYTVKSPVLVRSAFTGKMHFDAGILRLRTRALDFAGDLPFRQLVRGEPC